MSYQHLNLSVILPSLRFTGSDVCRIAEITRPQLRYWYKNGFITRPYNAESVWLCSLIAQGLARGMTLREAHEAALEYAKDHPPFDALPGEAQVVELSLLATLKALRGRIEREDTLSADDIYKARCHVANIELVLSQRQREAR